MRKAIKKTTAILLTMMFILTSLFAPGIDGAISAHADGTTYTVANEDFASLGASATATLPEGWKVNKDTSVRTIGSYSTASNATEKAGGPKLSSTAGNGIYNFGADDTHRAVGFLSSGSATKNGNLYYKWTNDTGNSLKVFNVGYSVEKYRNGSNPACFSIKLFYSGDGSNWKAAGENFNIAFTSDSDNSGAEEVPIETKSISNQTIDTLVSDGQSVYFAWNYSVSSGSTTSNAQALGITDVLITAAAGSGGSSAPVITHTAVTNAVENDAIVITADIGDESTVTAAVYYGNNADGSTFTDLIPMEDTSGSSYKATIVDPAAGDLYYYIAASNSSGETATHPSDITNSHKITVSAPISTIDIATARTKDIGDIVSVTGVVTFKDGSNYYIQDATGGIDIYGSGLSLAVRDRIIATGPIATYNGLLEIIPADTADVCILSSGNELPAPKPVTISQINDSIESQLVKLEQVTLGAINTGGNTPITDASAIL